MIMLPKYDIVFKMLFGDSRNIDILKSFLKAVLNEPWDEIDDIHLVDTHLKREFDDDKLNVVDVRMEMKSGGSIIVEMQAEAQSAFPARIVHGNGKAFVSQLKKGEEYSNLKKTISIAITNFEFDNLNDKRYHHVFHFNDDTSGVMLTDIVEIVTLELKKIPPQSDMTEKYDWLKFIKSEKEEEFAVVAQKNPEIDKAYSVLKVLSADESARMIYEARLTAERDRLAKNRWEVQKGREEGRAEIIYMMLESMSVEDVAKVLKMTPNEVQTHVKNFK